MNAVRGTVSSRCWGRFFLISLTYFGGIRRPIIISQLSAPMVPILDTLKTVEAFSRVVDVLHATRLLTSMRAMRHYHIDMHARVERTRIATARNYSSTMSRGAQEHRRESRRSARLQSMLQREGLHCRGMLEQCAQGPTQTRGRSSSFYAYGCNRWRSRRMSGARSCSTHPARHNPHWEDPLVTMQFDPSQKL